MKISNKSWKEIETLISNVVSLNDIEEFNDYFNRELFKNSPEQWEDEERTICDYQGRIINKLILGLGKVFEREEIDNPHNFLGIKKPRRTRRKYLPKQNPDQ
jgi:hypothetical protein